MQKINILQFTESFGSSRPRISKIGVIPLMARTLMISSLVSRPMGKKEALEILGNFSMRRT
jgi:hypothetical protein